MVTKYVYTKTALFSVMILILSAMIGFKIDSVSAASDPKPDIVGVYGPSEITLGDSASLKARCENDGGDAVEGDIGISFPDFDDDRYLESVDKNTLDNYKIVEADDEKTWFEYGSYQDYTDELYIVGWDAGSDGWDNGERHDFEFEVTPQESGKFYFHVKCVMSDSDEEWYGDPTPGSSYPKDAVEERSYRYYIDVVVPDLEVDDIWLDPSDPEEDEPTDIYFRIENTGSGDIDDSFRSKLKIDGSTYGYKTTSSLDSGSSRDYYFNDVKLSSGNHELEVIVDVDDDIDEESESNNDRDETHYWSKVTPSAYLYQVSYDNTIELGESVDITIRGKNNGDETAREGDLGISFPAFTNDDHAEVIDEDLDDYKIVEKDKTKTWFEYGSYQDYTDYLYIVGWDAGSDGWAEDETHYLKVRVTPQQTGSFTFYTKHVVQDDDDEEWYGDPAEDGSETSQKDAVKEYAEKHTITVNAEKEPSAYLYEVSYDDTIELGDTVDITIRGRNDGDEAAREGDLGISFPSFTNDDYAEVIGDDLDDYKVVEKDKTKTWFEYGSYQDYTDYLYIVGWDAGSDGWAKDESHYLKVRVTPQSTGTFTFYAKHVVQDDDDEDWFGDPAEDGSETSQKDAVKEYAEKHTITVNAEKVPSPYLYEVSYDDTIELGDSVDITIRGKNNGDETAREGDLGISFPAFTNDDYAEVIDEDLDDYKLVEKDGEKTWFEYGSYQDYTDYLYIVGWDAGSDGWAKDESHFLKVRVTPQQTGTFTFYTKHVVQDDDDEDWFGDPAEDGSETSQKDAVKEYAQKHTITVNSEKEPSANLYEVTYDDSIALGESVDITIRGKNDGEETAREGDLGISFPAFTNDDNAEVIDEDLDDYKMVEKDGEKTWFEYGSYQDYTDYLYIVGWDAGADGWAVDEAHFLKVRVTPQQTGTFTFYTKHVVQDDDDEDWFGDPAADGSETSQKDAVKEYAEKHTITVNPEKEPSAYLYEVTYEDSIALGESVDITIRAKNDGEEAAREGDIGISFPAFTTDDYVEVIDEDLDDYRLIEKDGEKTWFEYGSYQDYTDYLYVVGWDAGADGWAKDEAHFLKVKVTPQQTGTFTFYTKHVVQDDDDEDWYGDPAEDGSDTTQKDAVKEYAEKHTITVNPEKEPSANLYEVIYDDTIDLGDSVEITLKGKNDGSEAAREGDLGISFPDFTTDDHVEVIDEDLDDYKLVEKDGEKTWFEYGSYQDFTDYLYVVGWDAGADGWAKDESHYLKVRVTPQETGTFTFYAKHVVQDDDGEEWYGDPAEDGSDTTQKDAVKEYAQKYTITVNPGKAPSASLYDVVYDSSINLGEAVDITLKGRNNGDETAREGDLGISFPGFTTDDHVEVIDDDLDGHKLVEKDGEKTWFEYGSYQYNTDYLYVVGWDAGADGWAKDETHYLKVRVTPQQTGTFTFYTKHVIQDDDDEKWYGDPATDGSESTQKDAVKEYAQKHTISVNPAKAPIPNLYEVSYDDSITLGDSVVITLRASNTGDESAREGDIGLSFPDFTTDDYVSIVDDDLDDTKIVEKDGERTWQEYGSHQDYTDFLYVVGWDAGSDGWIEDETHYLKVRVTPQDTGTFTFFAKHVIQDDDDEQWYGDPAADGSDTSQKDAVEEYAWSHSITVKPAKQPIPEIISVTFDDTLTIGESTTIIVSSRNKGEGNAVEGDLALSFPSLTTRTHASDIGSTMDDVLVFDEESDKTWFEYGSHKDYVEFQYVVGYDAGSDGWESGEQHTLTLDITPQKVGTFTFYVKQVLATANYAQWYGDPDTDGENSSYRDAVDEYAWKYSIEVIPEEPDLSYFEFKDISPNVFELDAEEEEVSVFFEAWDMEGDYQLDLKVVTPDTLGDVIDEINDGNASALEEFNASFAYRKDIDLSNVDGHSSLDFDISFPEESNYLFLYALLYKDGKLVKSYSEHVFRTPDGELFVYDVDADDTYASTFTWITDLQPHEMIIWKEIMYPSDGTTTTIEIPFLIELDDVTRRQMYEGGFANEANKNIAEVLLFDIFFSNLYMGLKPLWDQYVMGKYDDDPFLYYILNNQFVLVGFYGTEEEGGVLPYKLISTSNTDEIDALIDDANAMDLDIVWRDEDNDNIFRQVLGVSNQVHTTTYFTLEPSVNGNDRDAIHELFSEIKTKHDVGLWTMAIIELADLILISHGATKLVKLASLSKLDDLVKFTMLSARFLGKPKLATKATEQILKKTHKMIKPGRFSVTEFNQLKKDINFMMKYLDESSVKGLQSMSTKLDDALKGPNPYSKIHGIRGEIASTRYNIKKGRSVEIVDKDGGYDIITKRPGEPKRYVEVTHKQGVGNFDEINKQHITSKIDEKNSQIIRNIENNPDFYKDGKKVVEIHVEDGKWVDDIIKDPWNEGLFGTLDEAKASPIDEIVIHYRQGPVTYHNPFRTTSSTSTISGAAEIGVGLTNTGLINSELEPEYQTGSYNVNLVSQTLGISRSGANIDSGRGIFDPEEIVEENVSYKYNSEILITIRDELGNSVGIIDLNGTTLNSLDGSAIFIGNNSNSIIIPGHDTIEFEIQSKRNGYYLISISYMLDDQVREFNCNVTTTIDAIQKITIIRGNDNVDMLKFTTTGIDKLSLMMNTYNVYNATQVYSTQYSNVGKNLDPVLLLETTWNNESVKVTPKSPYPVIQEVLEIEITAGKVVNLSVMATDIDGYVISYQWDFEGDGTYDYTSDISGNAIHTYSSPGAYLVKVKVTDNDGLQTGYEIRVVVMANEGNGDDDSPAVGFIYAIFVVLLVGLLSRRRRFEKFQ